MTSHQQDAIRARTLVLPRRGDDKAWKSAFFDGPTAYRYTGRGLVVVNPLPNPDFINFATDWEKTWSVLTVRKGAPRVVKPVFDPIIDEHDLVVGHVGWVGGSFVLVPVSGPANPREFLAHLVDGNLAFVRDLGVQVGGTRVTVRSRPSGMSVTDPNKGERINNVLFVRLTDEERFRLVTDVEGRALALLDAQSIGLVNADDVFWTLLGIGSLVAGLGALAIRQIVRTLVRTATTRATRRLVGQRLVGTVTVDEMEAYLTEVLANRPDLRRLMAARVMTGQGRMDAIRQALKEFSDTQHWTVKEKSAAEMEAVTTRDNIVVMRPQIRELWINTDHTARWNADEFYEHVSHDLSAHALAGHGGLLGPADLPFLGESFTPINNGLFLLENAVRRGDLRAMLAIFR